MQTVRLDINTIEVFGFDKRCLSFSGYGNVICPYCGKPTEIGIGSHDLVEDIECIHCIEEFEVIYTI